MGWMLLSRGRWGDLIRAHDWDAMDDFEGRDLVTIERGGIDKSASAKRVQSIVHGSTGGF